MASKTPKGGRSSVSPAKGQRAQYQQQDPEYVVLDKDLVRGLSEKEVEIEHLKAIVTALQNKITVIEDIKIEVKDHKQMLKQSESKREELQVHITQTSVTIQQDTIQHNEFQQELSKQIDQLKSQIQQQKAYQSQRDQEHSSKYFISYSNLFIRLDSLQQSHSQQLQNLTSDYQKQTQNLIKDYNQKLETQQQEAQDKYDKLFKEKENMRHQKDQELINKSSEMEQQRHQYEMRIDTLESKVRQLREIITVKQDIEAQLKTARDYIQQLESQKFQLQKELEVASDYLLQLEEKVYKANKTSLELLRQLKDAEVEIETLKNYIIELKQRIAVYIPIKDDAIDKKLAEFINNYPERQKLKIMFMRESEGVYQFGTKRVAVRVDKDKINIRVGGGYLSIDEFLDQYTPAELEKLERKDPLKKFSEKIAVQKTIAGKEVRESSPVRSTGQSPLRKQQ